MRTSLDFDLVPLCALRPPLPPIEGFMSEWQAVGRGLYGSTLGLTRVSRMLVRIAESNQSIHIRTARKSLDVSSSGPHD